MYFWRYICLLALLVLVHATDVQKCPKNSARKLEATEVTITGCPKAKCTLKRKTDVSIEMKFVPERDFTELVSNISGIILDVPLPFPGVYGTDACENIFDEAGKKHVGCPLKSGQTYTYKKTVPILPIYPTINLVIHCGLGDSRGDVACFELPARIK